MNAVEIEAAISDLALQPFDWETFPFAFLQAFGNKETTLKRLRSGASNKSDLGGVLQTSNPSPAPTRFPDHFGFFLPLAGITTVKQIRESAFDIKATGRLNRLYVELLKDNPEWGTEARRHDMNHFMARLIFCFFAEDTGIFNGGTLFTTTIEQMSDGIQHQHPLGHQRNLPRDEHQAADRPTANLRNWADAFPYVNGGLFSGGSPTFRAFQQDRAQLPAAHRQPRLDQDQPRHLRLDDPGRRDDEERGALGMHYTSVPNILKVLNPLFLDDLRGKLEEAGDKRAQAAQPAQPPGKIRVFDPPADRAIFSSSPTSRCGRSRR
jgi:hypothetical protein